MGAFITSSLIGREGLRLPEPSAALGKHQAPFSGDGARWSAFFSHIPTGPVGESQPCSRILSYTEDLKDVCLSGFARYEQKEMSYCNYFMREHVPSHLLCWHWLQLWGHSAYMHVREANPQSLTFVSNELCKWQAGTFLLGVMFTWMIQLLCTECWWILHHHPGLHQLMIIFDKLFLATLQPHYCDLYLGRHGFPRSCFTTLKLCVLNNRLE